MIDGVQLSILMGICFVAFYTLNFILIARYAGQRQNRSWKLSYTLMAFGLIVLLTLQPVLLPWLGVRSAARWAMGIQIVGLLFIVASLSLQLWARLHLGRFYAERAEVQPGHRLISSGPYAYMRHPLFTSYFLFGIGLFLIAPSVLTLTICIYIFWDFSHAAIKDEKVMAENMPEYKAYMQRTPRFFPLGPWAI